MTGEITATPERPTLEIIARNMDPADDWSTPFDWTEQRIMPDTGQITLLCDLLDWLHQEIPHLTAQLTTPLTMADMASRKHYNWRAATVYPDNRTSPFPSRPENSIKGINEIEEPPPTHAIAGMRRKTIGWLDPPRPGPAGRKHICRNDPLAQTTPDQP